MLTLFPIAQPLLTNIGTVALVPSQGLNWTKMPPFGPAGYAAGPVEVGAAVEEELVLIPILVVLVDVEALVEEVEEEELAGAGFVTAVDLVKP